MPRRVSIRCLWRTSSVSPGSISVRSRPPTRSHSRRSGSGGRGQFMSSRTFSWGGACRDCALPDVHLKRMAGGTPSRVYSCEEMKMSKPWDLYVKEMTKRFGYMATWTPGVPIELGDVGVVRDNVFTRVTSLRSLDIPVEVRSDPTEESIDYSSSGSVSLTFKAAGQAPAAGSALVQAEAGLVIEFTRDGAVVFKAAGCVTPSIEDVEALKKQVLARYREGRWNKDWAVVTEVVRARAATILLSERRGARVEISARGKVDAGAIDLTNVDIGLTVVSKRDMETTLISQGGLTPLFKARSVQARG